MTFNPRPSELGDLASKIASRWASIAMNLNIDPVQMISCQLPPGHTEIECARLLLYEVRNRGDTMNDVAQAIRRAGLVVVADSLQVPSRDFNTVFAADSLQVLSRDFNTVFAAMPQRKIFDCLNVRGAGGQPMFHHLASYLYHGLPSHPYTLIEVSSKPTVQSLLEDWLVTADDTTLGAMRTAIRQAGFPSLLREFDQLVFGAARAPTVADQLIYAPTVADFMKNNDPDRDPDYAKVRADLLALFSQPNAIQMFVSEAAMKNLTLLNARSYWNIRAIDFLTGMSYMSMDDFLAVLTTVDCQLALKIRDILNRPKENAIGEKMQEIANTNAILAFLDGHLQKMPESIKNKVNLPALVGRLESVGIDDLDSLQLLVEQKQWDMIPGSSVVEKLFLGKVLVL